MLPGGVGWRPSVALALCTVRAVLAEGAFLMPLFREGHDRLAVVVVVAVSTLAVVLLATLFIAISGWQQP